jgi:hypothetical protein
MDLLRHVSRFSRVDEAAAVHLIHMGRREIEEHTDDLYAPEVAAEAKIGWRASFST